MPALFPALIPSKRSTRIALGVACALGVGISAGCKSKGGNAGVAGQPASMTSDPLLGIPPQNLPIPSRDTYGATGKPDPLLTGGNANTPAAPGSATERTERSPPPKASTSSDDSANRTLPPSSTGTQGPYRPSRGSTAAALAGVTPVPVDDTDLSIGSRPAVTPAGGIPTAIPGSTAPLRSPPDANLTGGMTFEQITTQLRKYGAKFTAADKEGSGYTFRVDVPVPGGMPGQVRRYEGAGPTPAAAAKQVLDQVKVDIPAR